MEREANYTAVGAFVLLIATLGGFFVYWYAGSGDAREYKRYEIYFEGSVSGLIRGSTVRYLGVDVGRVIDIRIDKRWQFRDYRISTYLDIQNAYNNAAAEALVYNFNFTKQQYQTGLPIIPSFGVRGEF